MELSKRDNAALVRAVTFFQKEYRVWQRKKRQKKARRVTARARPTRLRYAFIGAGGIAGAHINALKKMDEVEIVALADINDVSMARHAENHGISECYTDYKEMLAKVQPDAVSICTPNGLHARNAIDALNAGAHVLVEKPTAMNAREGEAMIDAAGRNKRKLVVAFQYRLAPNTTFLRRATEAGQFGRILYARSHALRRRGIPNWGVFGRKELQGGGPLIDIGVHILEVTDFVMGAPRPVAATGQTFTYLGDKKCRTECQWPSWDYKTYTVEDLAVGQIRFENGAMLTLEASFAAHIEKNEWNFVIMGEKAGASWEPPAIFRDDAGYMVNTTPAYVPSAGFGELFDAKVRDFVDYVLYDKPTLSPAEDGLAVQKMLDAIYESAEKGREVKIK